MEKKVPPPFKVEHICELPTNLAKTELVVRPCVAFLNPGDESHGKEVDAEETLIPRLDAKEVAAVFSAPFHNFLLARDEVKDGSRPLGKPSDWYRGSWTDWHQSQWRMHKFFVPTSDQRITKAKTSGQGQREAAENLERAQRDGSLTRYMVFGMTARILVDCARVAYAQEPEFEHNSHFGDEDMILRLLKIGRLHEMKRPSDELKREDMEKAARTKI